MGRWLPELRSRFANTADLLKFFADRSPSDVLYLPMLTPIAQYKIALAAQAVASPSRSVSAVLSSIPEERTTHDTAPAAAVFETNPESETKRESYHPEGNASIPSEGQAERDGWALQLLPSVIPKAEQRLRELALLVQRLHDLLKQAEVVCEFGALNHG